MWIFRVGCIGGCWIAERYLDVGNGLRLIVPGNVLFNFERGTINVDPLYLEGSTDPHGAGKISTTSKVCAIFTTFCLENSLESVRSNVGKNFFQKKLLGIFFWTNP